MDPLTVKAGEFAIGKAIDAVFGEIVNKFQKKRARTFFEAFCREVAVTEMLDLDEPDDLKKKIKNLFNDDLREQAFYENYRSSILSASQKLGPCILALITANLINEKRASNSLEDSFCMACEHLKDHELDSFHEKFMEEKSKNEKNQTLTLHSETLSNLNFHFPKQLPTWISKLGLYGVVTRIDNFMAIGQGSAPGAPTVPTIMVTTSYEIHKNFEHLVDLIGKAKKLYKV